MEELIKQILEIEEKAQEVVRAARQADSELSARINRDSIKLQSDIEKQTQEKSNSLRQIEENDAEKKISGINAETEKTMAAFEERYRENKDKWVEQIVKGVIEA